MNLAAILQNHILWTGITSWFLAQAVKTPLNYLREKQWNWALFFAAGGMPSSHSCLVSSVALATGLYIGFNSAIFAVAVAFAMVVVYDSMGVRRQAGMQAQKINVLIQELLKGHQINEQQLLEVIGHSPLEALAGTLLGLGVTMGLWLWWR